MNVSMSVNAVDIVGYWLLESVYYSALAIPNFFLSFKSFHSE